jgi:Glyoxalase-like domain
MSAYLDHIVVVCPELDAGSSHFENLTGVRPRFGGVHAGGRTHNALVRIGSRCYLEILAPTGPPSAEDDLWCRIAHATREPRVLTYCLRSPQPLPELAAVANAHGWQNAQVALNGRTTPEGIALRWQWLAPKVDGLDLAFPFFIDWFDSPHPADTLAQETELGSLTLSEFAVRHPEATRLRAILDELGTPIDTVDASSSSFLVVLDTPRGRIAL